MFRFIPITFPTEGKEKILKIVDRGSNGVILRRSKPVR